MLPTLVIAIAFLHVNNAEITSLSRTFTFSEDQLIKHRPWHDNTKLLYARCNASQPGLGKKCVVSMTVDAFENSTSVASECVVTLKPEIPKALVNDNLLVFKFGNDKVIIAWMESMNSRNGSFTVKTSVVHMLNHCQTFGATIYNYSGQSFTIGVAYETYINVIASTDTYELVLKDVINDCRPRTNCTRDYGIFKYDAQARKLSGPDHWPTPTYSDKLDVNIVVAVEPGRSENGYFIFNRNESQSIACIAVKEKDDYKKLVLKETKDTKSIWFSRVSLANQSIGICYHFTSNSNIACWQFNQKGQLQSHTRINFKHQHRMTLASIYNVNNGGFLMILVDCQTNHCDGSNNNYSFIKIGKDGPVDVVKFRFDAKCNQQNNRIALRAFENKKKQYCVVRLCESKVHNSMRLDTVVRCFASSDFSKCNDCL